MSRILACVILAWSSTAFAAENGLLFYTSFGLSQALAPNYLTAYWQPGLQVNAGIGVELADDLAASISFVHHSFDYDDKVVVPVGDQAGANEMTIKMIKSITVQRFPNFLPFYSFGVGVTLLSTPDMYKAQEPFQTGQRGEFLEPRHSSSRLSTGIGLGVKYRTDSQTDFFLELCTRTTLLSKQPFAYIAGRLGLAFQI